MASWHIVLGAAVATVGPMIKDAGTARFGHTGSKKDAAEKAKADLRDHRRTLAVNVGSLYTNCELVKDTCFAARNYPLAYPPLDAATTNCTDGITHAEQFGYSDPNSDLRDAVQLYVSKVQVLLTMARAVFVGRDDHGEIGRAQSAYLEVQSLHKPLLTQIFALVDGK